MVNSSSRLILSNVPFFLGGIFLIYLAVLDETLFNFILHSFQQDKIIISIATTVAAGVPMFFAVGFIKKSVLRRWQTIYYYEKLLLHDFFWILTIILLGIISSIIVIDEGIHQFNFPILLGCVLFSVYLFRIYLNSRKKKFP
jgi:hypothetical protein